jgi:hypothetical protein
MNKAKLLEQLRKECDDLTLDTHFKRGYAHAIVDVDHFPDDPTPAIDWKPINITQMKVGRNYLLWDECHVCPIAGFMDASGDLIKLSSGRVLNDVTHYAEFNKPEGVE